MPFTPAGKEGKGEALIVDGTPCLHGREGEGGGGGGTKGKGKHQGHS